MKFIYTLTFNKFNKAFNFLERLEGKLHDTLRSSIRREAGPWNTKARLIRQSGTPDDEKIPNRPCRRSQSDHKYTGSTLAIGEMNEQGKWEPEASFS